MEIELITKIDDDKTKFVNLTNDDNCIERNSMNGASEAIVRGSGTGDTGNTGSDSNIDNVKEAADREVSTATEICDDVFQTNTEHELDENHSKRPENDRADKTKSEDQDTGATEHQINNSDGNRIGTTESEMTAETVHAWQSSTSVNEATHQFPSDEKTQEQNEIPKKAERDGETTMLAQKDKSLDNGKTVKFETQDNAADVEKSLKQIADFDISLAVDAAPPEPTLKWKVIKTLFLVFVWVCLGLCGEITGPTLLDLKLRTHSNYESVSSGVSGRSAGFFIGSAVGGVLVDRFGLFCDVMVAMALDGEAAATVAIPWMPTTSLIFVMTMMQGIMEGVINIAGQKLILNMWQDRAAAPLHLLHGGFGIGSFIIPLVANPFLAVTEDLAPNITNVTMSTGVPITTVSTTTTEKIEVVLKESRMEYAYMIAAAVAVGVSLCFYAYHMAGRQDRERHRQSTAQDKSDTRTISFREMFNPATCAGNLLYGVLIFGLTFLFFIQAVGGERVGGKFIRTYSIKYLDFSDDDGSYINTVFWIAFAVGRVLGLVTARFIPIRLLIMLETGGCLLTAILLVFFGDDDPTALWILMPAIGFFIAPLFPSGVGWANYHVEMTGIAITFFMLGGSVGGIIYMRLTGYLFDNYGYKTFLYMLLGFAIAAFGVATLMNIVGLRHGSRFDREKRETDVTVGLDDEKEAVKFKNEGYSPE